MKFFKILPLLACLFGPLTQTSLAESIKTIQLKDGSVLQGTVLQLANGVYTIDTANLGKIEINESKISSIADKKQAVQNTNMPAAIQGLQSQLMADPNFINKVMKISENPEIMEMLSDPALMQDVQSFNLEGIQNNPQTQKLMNNPEIQALMQEMQKKMK